jgi:hypothetical protein
MLLKSRAYIPGSVMLFESRYHRFVYISDVSVLNEGVWGFLRVKHVLYSFLAVIFLGVAIVLVAQRCCRWDQRLSGARDFNH